MGVHVMTQAEFNRDVAEALGATLAEVQRQGFDLERDLSQLEAFENRRPMVFDWDTEDIGAWPFD
jgi:hypothetical protein